MTAILNQQTNTIVFESGLIVYVRKTEEKLYEVRVSFPNGSGGMRLGTYASSEDAHRALDTIIRHLKKQDRLVSLP